MPRDNPCHPGLDQLQQRLDGGIAAAIAGHRTTRAHSAGSADVDASHDCGILTATDQEPMWQMIRRASTLVDGLTADTVDRQLDNISTHLRGDRDLLLAVLLAPLSAAHAATEKFQDLHRRDIDPSTAAITEWFWLCWLAEAAWRAVAIEPAGDGTALIGDDRRLLHPAANRMRFLILSEPFRHDRDPDDGWRHIPGSSGMGFAGRAFGTNSEHLLLDRCRAARRTWQSCLDEYQSHPLLATAGCDQLEAELDPLLFTEPAAGHRRLLAIAARDANGVRTPNRQDHTSVDGIVEQHLLPRFKVIRAAQVAARTGRTAWLTATVVTALVIAALGAAGTGSFPTAAYLASGSYTALAIGVLWHGQSWAAPWLLRIPAANAFGVFALTTLHPQWWQSSSRWPVASVVLLLASLGYLGVEARNHGVDAPNAVLRALGITAIGAGHALLVALIGLVLVAPEYAEAGADLAAVWRTNAGWSVLLSGAAWCLAIGVFSQILWDDRPITAPLAHLRWRRGG